MKKNFNSYIEFIKYINYHFILIYKNDTKKYYLNYNPNIINHHSYSFLILLFYKTEIDEKRKQIQNAKYFNDIIYNGEHTTVFNLETYYNDIFNIKEIRKKKLQKLYGKQI